MNQEQLTKQATILKKAIHSLQEDAAAGRFTKDAVIKLALATEKVLQAALDLEAVEFGVDGYLIRTGTFTSQEAVEAYLMPQPKPAISRPVGKAPIIHGCKLREDKSRNKDYFFFTGTLEGCRRAAVKLAEYGIDTPAIENGNGGNGYILVPLFVSGEI